MKCRRFWIFQPIVLPRPPMTRNTNIFPIALTRFPPDRWWMEYLVPELPFGALMKGAADGIDVLVGSTADEGSLFTNTKLGLPKLFPVREEDLNKFFSDHPKAKKEKILALYPDYPENHTFQEIARRFSTMWGFAGGGMSGRAWGKCLRLLYYLHNADATGNRSGRGPLYQHFHACGKCGGDASGSVREGAEYSVRETASGAVGEFFRTGNPSVAGYPDWPAYGKEKNTYFIDVTSCVKQHPFTEIEETYGDIRPYGN